MAVKSSLGLLKESIYNNYILNNDSEGLKKFANYLKENKDAKNLYFIYESFKENKFDDKVLAKEFLVESIKNTKINLDNIEINEEIIKENSGNITDEESLFYENVDNIIKEHNSENKNVKSYIDSMQYLIENHLLKVEQDTPSDDLLAENSEYFFERRIMDDYNKLNENEKHLVNVLASNDETKLKEFTYLKNLAESKINTDIENVKSEEHTNMLKESYKKVNEMTVENLDENITKLHKLIYN